MCLSVSSPLACAFSPRVCFRSQRDEPQQKRMKKAHTTTRKQDFSKYQDYEAFTFISIHQETMNHFSRIATTKCPGGMVSFVLSMKRILPPRLLGHWATLATKSNNNNNNNNSKRFLVNEALVQAIRRRARNVSPQDIQVRLLVHPSKATKTTSTTTQLLSLPQAVQLSVQQKLDLIGVSLEQDVPVIRMDQLNSFLYKQEKENSVQKRRTTKEVQMQHKIAPHDMERKLQQVTKFLEKGHICVIKMPLSLLDTILTQLPTQAELMHPPQIEGQKALIRVHSK